MPEFKVPKGVLEKQKLEQALLRISALEKQVKALTEKVDGKQKKGKE